MRTLGFVAGITFLAAVYFSPDAVHEIILDATTLGRTGPVGDPSQGWARRAEVVPAGRETVIQARPWDTVSDAVADARLVRVTDADLQAANNETIFTVGLSQGVTAEVFTLANPYRVVVDMPEVAFRLPDGTGRTGRGLVKAFRYGLFSADKGRIVLDITEPARIVSARLQDDGAEMQLEIRLAAISAEEFGRGTGPVVKEAPAELEEADQAPQEPLDKPPPARPVIVIDPGHGGIDPGAVGVDNLLEKDVVLGVAKALRAALKRSGSFDVHLTRSRDVFLSLSRRVEVSREHKADLFVSLHADSVPDISSPEKISGASVYTLSHRASDALARKMAEKENASDVLAGIATEESQGGSDVRSILFDLMRREASNFSTEFSNVLLRQLRRDVSLSRGPKRSAAFKVLKQSHAPSVLIELGYMSNPDDVVLMRTEKWRLKIAGSIARAVTRYFEKRQARR